MSKGKMLNLTLGVLIGVIAYASFIEHLIPLERVRD